MARTHETLSSLFSDIADAIRGKTGGTDTIVADEFPTAISEIPSGGGTVGENDVNFYDYDGTLLHSYTKAEFLQLTAMPNNPDRTSEGLIAQGWNWSLQDAQDYVNDYGFLDIGALYIPTDGANKIHIRIPVDNFTISFGGKLNGTCTINWGDGSQEETFTNEDTAPGSRPHTYTTAGNYVISVIVSNGTMTFQKTAYANMSSVIRKPDDYTTIEFYPNLITKVHIGNNTNLGESAFQLCRNLEYITFPNGMTISGITTLQVCNSLKGLILPNSVTSLKYNFVNTCYSLKYLLLPNTITTIESGAVEYCKLKKLYIPNSVTTMSSTLANTPVLKRAIFPKSLTSIATGVSLQSLKTVEEVYYYSNVNIPYSFCYNTQAKKIVIGSDNLLRLGTQCFGNTNITELNLPDTITAIEESALSGIYCLKKIKLPASLTSMGQYMFWYMESTLEEIDMSDILAVPALGGDLFSLSNINPLFKIKVPQALLADFQTASVWSKYASYMVGV